jgi:MFS family permease
VGCEAARNGQNGKQMTLMAREEQAAAPSDYVSALVASFLAWTLDAFDFFILVFVMPAIAKDFQIGIPAVAATLAVTLAFRPVGALVFGLLADRYGRRRPLMFNLVFYSLVEVLFGLASSYTSFLVLRALFGIGMGGEWGVGASLVMEKVPRRCRGLLSGVLQEGYAVGYLLAACCYFFVFSLLGLAAHVFYRRSAGLARFVCTLSGQGISGLAQDAGGELARRQPRGFV